MKASSLRSGTGHEWPLLLLLFNIYWKFLYMYQPNKKEGRKEGREGGKERGKWGEEREGGRQEEKGINLRR